MYVEGILMLDLGRSVQRERGRGKACLKAVVFVLILVAAFDHSQVNDSQDTSPENKPQVNLARALASLTIP